MTKDFHATGRSGKENKMDECITCNSNRIVYISGKSSDLNYIRIGEAEHEGYVPYGLGIGGSDYIEFEFCLNCGQIQGGFPKHTTQLEK